MRLTGGLRLVAAMYSESRLLNLAVLYLMIDYLCYTAYYSTSVQELYVLQQSLL